MCKVCVCVCEQYVYGQCSVQYDVALCLYMCREGLWLYGA